MLDQQSPHSTVIAVLAEALRPKLYVEIGSYQGRTMDAVRPYCARVIGVDNPPGSDAFFAGWDGGQSMDMVFIDGDHRRAQLTRDVLNALPLLTDTGLIILHDTYPETEEQLADGFCSDAWKVPQFLKRGSYGIEVLTIPALCGLTLIRRPYLPPYCNGL